MVQLSLQSKASANAELEKGGLEKAGELYLRGIRRLNDLDLDEHPEARTALIPILLNLALCRLRMSEPGLAKNAASRALELDPRNEKGLYRRAEALSQLGEHKASEKDLMSLVKLYPSNKTALKLLHEVRDRHAAAQALSQEQAKKMIGSGDLRRRFYQVRDSDNVKHGEDASTLRQDFASALHPADSISTPADADSTSTGSRTGKTSMKEYMEEWEKFAASLPPVKELPKGWEMTHNDNGSEVWRRCDINNPQHFSDNASIYSTEVK